MAVAAFLGFLAVPAASKDPAFHFEAFAGGNLQGANRSPGEEYGVATGGAFTAYAGEVQENTRLGVRIEFTYLDADVHPIVDFSEYVTSFNVEAAHRMNHVEGYVHLGGAWFRLDTSVAPTEDAGAFNVGGGLRLYSTPEDRSEAEMYLLLPAVSYCHAFNDVRLNVFRFYGGFGVEF